LFENLLTERATECVAANGVMNAGLGLHGAVAQNASGEAQARAGGPPVVGDEAVKGSALGRRDDVARAVPPQNTPGVRGVGGSEYEDDQKKEGVAK
jgi:hypothetical protein